MIVSCHYCAAAGQLSCGRKSGDWFWKVWYGAPESSWPSSDSSWQCYHMLGTATKLSTLFQVLVLWLHLRKKQDLNNIKNVKGCRDSIPTTFWYGAPESSWPSSDSSWQCYHMLGTATKLSTLFQVLVLWLHLRKKQDLNNIKNVKGCRDSIPKRMQTR